MWLAVLAICGGGLVLPSVLAAVALVIVPSYFTEISPNYQLLIFGLGATVVSLVARSGIDWSAIFARLALGSSDRWQRHPLRRPVDVPRRPRADAATSIGVGR